MNSSHTFPITLALDGAILVIDDEPDIREALTDILSMFTEVPVYAAANGHEGLQIFQQAQQPIVLVFLDMNMPVMNGEETYARLQQIAPEVKVIISSSLSQAETTHRLGQHKPPTLLQKSFGINTLLQTLVTLFAMP
ncbi:MAG: response regulator [Candidatus Promineifilaceae bacterium]